MWFVSKKKYNELLKQKEDFNKIATKAVAQNGRLLEQWGAAIEEMKELRAFSLRLSERNEASLTRIKELEAELQRARQTNQQWAEDFEELDNAYGRLETDYDKLREELSHYEYEERFRNPEDELSQYQKEGDKENEE